MRYDEQLGRILIPPLLARSLKRSGHDIPAEDTPAGPDETAARVREALPEPTQTLDTDETGGSDVWREGDAIHQRFLDPARSTAARSQALLDSRLQRRARQR